MITLRRAYYAAACSLLLASVTGCVATQSAEMAGIPARETSRTISAAAEATPGVGRHVYLPMAGSTWPDSQILKGTKRLKLSEAEKALAANLALPGEDELPKGDIVAVIEMSSDPVAKGYAFYYRQKFEVVILPTDLPTEVDLMLEESEALDLRDPSVRARVYVPIDVNGVRGYGRESGKQVLEDGTVSEFPSVAHWQVPATDSRTRYVSYTVYGEGVPLARTLAIARSMTGRD